MEPAVIVDFGALFAAAAVVWLSGIRPPNAAVARDKALAIETSFARSASERDGTRPLRYNSVSNHLELGRMQGSHRIAKEPPAQCASAFPHRGLLFQPTLYNVAKGTKRYDDASSPIALSTASRQASLSASHLEYGTGTIRKPARWNIL